MVLPWEMLNHQWCCNAARWWRPPELREMLRLTSQRAHMLQQQHGLLAAAQDVVVFREARGVELNRIEGENTRAALVKSNGHQCQIARLASRMIF